MRYNVAVAIIDTANPPPELVRVAKKDKFEWGEIVGRSQGGTRYKVFPCHQAQGDILKSKAKFTFAFAGTGGGKTCLIPLWIFQQLNRCFAKGNKRPRILVVSPSANTFRKSQLKQHLLATFADTAFRGVWKTQESTYHLDCGGEIIVATVGDGGDYQKLSGGQYDAIVADEVYFLTSEVWAEIRRRSGQQNAPVLCVTTPNANNWIWEIKLEADKGNKDFYVRQWGSAENPSYSKEHLERERALMTDATYRRMYEGQFSAAEGLCYEFFADPHDRDRFPVIHGNPYDDGLPSKPVRFFGGNDWGFNDPAAMLMFAECEDGCIYCVEELFESKIGTDDLKRRALAMVDKWAVRVDSAYADQIDGGRFTCFWTDVSRPEHRVAFQGSGIPIRNKRVTDIPARVATTDKWFRSGRLKIYSCCKNLIRELQSYAWDVDIRGGLKDKPKGKNDHACDALSYSISSQMYGIEPSPVIRAPTDNIKEEKKLKRLGLLDEVVLKDKADEMEKRKYYDLAFGDDDWHWQRF